MCGDCESVVNVPGLAALALPCSSPVAGSDLHRLLPTGSAPLKKTQIASLQHMWAVSTVSVVRSQCTVVAVNGQSVHCRVQSVHITVSSALALLANYSLLALLAHVLSTVHLCSAWLYLLLPVLCLAMPAVYLAVSTVCV